MASPLALAQDVMGIVCSFLPAEDLIRVARVNGTWRRAVRSVKCAQSTTALRWGHLRVLTCLLSPQLISLKVDVTGTPAAGAVFKEEAAQRVRVSNDIRRLSVFTALAKLSLISHVFPITVFEDLEALTSLRCLHIERRTESQYTRAMHASIGLWSRLTELAVFGVPLSNVQELYLLERHRAGLLTKIVWEEHSFTAADQARLRTLTATCALDFNQRLEQWAELGLQYRDVVLHNSTAPTSDADTERKLRAFASDILAMTNQLIVPIRSSQSPMAMMVTHASYFTLIDERLRVLRSITDRSRVARVSEEMHNASRCRAALIDVLAAVPLTNEAEALAAQQLNTECLWAK